MRSSSPGYLFPFFRVFLFAEELRVNKPVENTLEVCGEVGALRGGHRTSCKTSALRVPLNLKRRVIRGADDSEVWETGRKGCLKAYGPQQEKRVRVIATACRSPVQISVTASL